MTENPLESPYRIIRRIAPPDAPLPGMLAACGEATVLLVDVAAVPLSHWTEETSGHLWVPQEVARIRGGHAAVYDWAARPLQAVLDRIADGGMAGGEAVTIGVSLLRGLGDLGTLSDEPVSGRWWLTDDGRPVFAMGDGALAQRATAECADDAARACADQSVGGVLSAIADLCARPFRVAAAQALEEQLFEAAAPAPVAPVADRPARESRPSAWGGRSGAQPTASGGHGSALRPPTAMRRSTTAPRPERAQSARALGAAAAAFLRSLAPRPAAQGTLPHAARPTAVADAHNAGRVTAPGRLRRLRPALIGVAVACVLVTGAVMALEGAGGGAAERSAAAARELPASGAGNEMTDPAAPAAAPDPALRGEDPVAAATALVHAAAACSAREDCEAIADDPAALERAAALTITGLTDDYGGVAVVAATGAERTWSLVVELRDGRWRIRDVIEHGAAAP